tara:strand:+ start:112 stop:834 length:723 start_codon:yes stop_codon:yes gene_type:complete
MVKIFIDTRETLLVNHFRRHKNAEIVSLDLGDIVIQHGDDTIAIERKTISDLASSIQDGRHREQKARLMDNYPQSRIVFMIEGGMRSDMEGQLGRVPITTVVSSILNSQMRDNLHVCMTNDTVHTINMIELLAKKMAKGDFASKTSHLSAEADYCTKLKSKKVDNNNPHVCFLQQLMIVPGLSASIADAIVQHYPSMVNLCSHMMDKDITKNIADILHGASQRRVGPKVATRLVEYLKGV